MIIKCFINKNIKEIYENNINSIFRNNVYNYL